MRCFDRLLVIARTDATRALALAGHGIQINAPLLSGDKFLQLVPASHFR